MLEFVCPWVLFFIPLPLILWKILPSATVRNVSGVCVPFYDGLTQHLSQATLSIPRKMLFFFGLIWTLLLIALSGPQWLGDATPLSREGRNILLGLDLSGSMEIPDMTLHGYPTSRLAVVKEAADAFVRARNTDRIGLILFGSEAYLQTPLTYDHATVLNRIQDATVGLAGKTTSLGDALGLAVKTLQPTPKKGRVIILLTDGANNSGVLSPEKAAELARAEHIKVYTIGLSTEVQGQNLTQLFVSMQNGADLDEATLKKIAKQTGGHYFRATNPTSLNHIYRTIDLLETVKQSDQTARPKTDYYPWPLTFALVLLGVWIGRRLR